MFIKTRAALAALAAGALATSATAEDTPYFSAVAESDYFAQATAEDIAQESAVDVAQGEDVIKPVGIEEITVTGRKREELLQSTPISVVAFGKEELEGRQIRSVTDLGEAVPNLKFDTGNGSSNQTRIYIRGVGQDDFRSNVDPGVGLYVDGVYIPRLTGAVVSTLDVEQIDVLRGPQGTLFGKNTVGGVVSIKTARPGPEFGGRAQFRYGNFNTVESQATVNIPLVPERVFSRFTFETQTDDGIYRNAETQSRAGDNKLLKGRAAFRMLLSDDMTLDLSYEQTKENEKQPTPECRLGENLSPGRFLTDNFARTADGRTFNEACLSDGDGNEFTASADFENKTDLETYFGFADFTWDLDSDMTFKALSSWRRVEVHNSGTDLDATAADAFGVRNGTSQNDVLSQEFQIVGTALDDKLKYSTGVYGFKESGHGRQTLGSLSRALDVIINGDPNTFLANDGGMGFFSLGLANSLAAAREGATSNNPVFDAVTQLNQTVIARFETLSYAAFLDGTYYVTEKLSVNAGARITKERRYRRGQTIRIPQAQALLNFVGPDGNPMPRISEDAARNIRGEGVSERFSRWTGLLKTDYQLTDDIFLYASYSRGFKSGGFNSTTIDPLDPDDQDIGKFDEEILDSYEIGIKTQWFDNRLIFNLTGFYNDYEDIQITSIQIAPDGTPEGRINNVAEATIKGIEADFQWRPIPQLTFSGGLGLTDVDYKDFIVRQDAASELRDQMGDLSNCRMLTTTGCDLGVLPGVIGFLLSPGEIRPKDFSDVDRSNTPSFNGNISAEYIYDLGDWGSLITRATWFVQGDVEYTTMNDQFVRQSKYGLLNGRVTWDVFDDQTSISFYGRNLLDRRYTGGGFSLDDTNGVKTVFFGQPRRYGVELLRRF